jgi:pilus assembly protein Flp/PilA
MLTLPARSRDERGATATEYGLLVLFIAIAIVASVTLFGQGLSQAYGSLSGRLIELAAQLV